MEKDKKNHNKKGPSKGKNKCADDVEKTNIIHSQNEKIKSGEVETNDE